MNTSVAYSGSFAGVGANDTLITNTMEVTFRTKTNGTLLHILGVGNFAGQNVRMSVYQGQIEVEMPVEASQTQTTFLYGSDVDDGEWHKLELVFDSEVVSARLDGRGSERLTLDFQTDLNAYIPSASIVVGSALQGQNSRNQYTVGDGSDDSQVDILLASAIDNGDLSESDFFRGCVGEIRLGGVLLPFFSESELVNSTSSRKFAVIESSNLVSGECTLCYENECVNGGSCADPNNVFECTCPVGFEDPLCSTNIDECINSTCDNGVCVDGVANYTCSCTAGWTGWL